MVFQKFNIKLPYNPAILPLDIYPKDFKAGTQTNTGTPMSVTESFTAAEGRKQPSCPSVDEWVRKMWAIRVVEYLALKIGRKY